MMPVAHYRRPGWARALLRNPRWALLATALVVASCTSDQPTEPAGPAKPPVSLRAIGCSGCVLLDHFSDVDGTLLESHAPDGEGIPFSWVRTVGPFAFRESAIVQNNAVGKDGPGFWRYLTSPEIIDTTVVTDTAEVEVEVLGVVPPSTQYDVGLIFRDPSPDAVGGFGGYTVFWSINGDGLGFFEVDKGDDNGSLILFQYHPEIPSVGTHILSASVSRDGVIRIYLDGSLEASVTDPSPLPAGDLGLTFGFSGTPGSMRISSFVGRRRPPAETVRIRPVTGSMQVRPVKTGGSSTLNLDIGVYDTHGQPVPNRTVKLELTAKELTAGHEHENQGDKPEGTLSETEVSTGSGVVRVTYQAPDPSGPVAIRGISDGAEDGLDTIRVMVPSLEQLPPSTDYRFVGLPGHHPGRFYVTPATRTALQTLAVDFRAVYAKTLGFNDASLEQGGVFDTKDDWLGIAVTHPHAEHRMGTNLDMRIIDREQKELNWVRAHWRKLSTLNVREAIKEETAPPHFHLRY